MLKPKSIISVRQKGTPISKDDLKEEAVLYYGAQKRKIVQILNDDETNTRVFITVPADSNRKYLFTDNELLSDGYGTDEFPNDPSPIGAVFTTENTTKPALKLISLTTVDGKDLNVMVPEDGKYIFKEEEMLEEFTLNYKNLGGRKKRATKKSAKKSRKTRRRRQNK